MNEMLKRHEGYREKPYRCTAGKLTIGYGYNLDAGMPEDEASLLLDFRVKKISKRLENELDFWWDLTDVRKDVLVDMAYNLGVDGLLKFKETLKLIRERRYEDAETQMLKSLWAKQVPNRAKELAELMRVG